MVSTNQTALHLEFFKMYQGTNRKCYIMKHAMYPPIAITHDTDHAHHGHRFQEKGTQFQWNKISPFT